MLYCNIFLGNFMLFCCLKTYQNASQRGPVFKFLWGGACPQTPLGGSACACYYYIVVNQNRTPLSKILDPPLKILTKNKGLYILTELSTGIF